jgi:hypothetical protein
MRYGDLIAFEPIDSIKVLTEADDADLAKRDVETFFISPQMRRMLGRQLFSHLSLDGSADTKGILVVANYGTGKTHLMATISAVVERADLRPSLTDAEVAEEVKPLAGRFRVIRAEIGATTMGLRDIVCGELERGLQQLGVEFSFPALDEVSNTKDSLVDMMAQFEVVEPERGLLFVLDELLDYLRSRRDVELTLDLAFLREIGEICRSTRFRFIAGIQEALFDNPRFASASESVRRVRDRFEQVRISREDVSYVVQERLLRKTSEQKEQIREHLQRFTPAFDGMTERLEEFVDLFPLHPAYLRTFERVTLVEKRRVLTTLSNAMRELIDSAVPDTTPGLICYDGYRAELAEDLSNRAVPEVAEVLDRSEVLREKLERALPRREDVAIALRIVDGLAVHRLTTEDIYVPIGVTVEELRDDLCLLPADVPELNASFIGATLETIVEEMIKAVSGQFLSRNEENGQLYLDVRKDIDYDRRIEERVAHLDGDRLDDAYFRALEEVLAQTDQPWVASYRIWRYELPWRSKNVTRTGYLFMGAPNQRSTAQPPQDFYIYFIQPYDPPRFADGQRADETFIRLADPDEDFTAALRRYAGAKALASEAGEQHRVVYKEKQAGALKDMASWLRENMASAFTVTYRGERKPLGAWLQGVAGTRSTVKAQIDAIAAAVLAPHFEARYPNYPSFTVEITRDTLEITVQQAIAQIVTRRTTTLGTKVLASLGLIDGDGVVVTDGAYAQNLLRQLAASEGQAVNRDVLLQERDPGVWTWGPWHLEPAWLAVVAAALSQLGQLEIGFADRRIDALGLDALAGMPIEELEGISHVAPPKALPVVTLRSVASLLGIAAGAIPESGVNEAIVRQILTAAQEMLGRVVVAEQGVAAGIQLWGALVVDRQAQRVQRLTALKSLLEDVRTRNSVGKMNRIAIGDEVLEDARNGWRELVWIETAQRAHSRLSAASEYVNVANAAFGASDALAEDAASLREEVLALFRADPIEPTAVADVNGATEQLRRRYREAAAQAHRRDRLDAAGEKRKREILTSDAYTDLEHLSTVKLLPDVNFASLKQRLLEIQSCPGFDERRLEEQVRCPDCGYEPRASVGPSALARVDQIGHDLLKLRGEWQASLRDSLREEQLAENITLLEADEREHIQAFADSGVLPSPIDGAFVEALNQVLRGFEVRKITGAELFAAIFPESAPATIETLGQRFRAFLERLQADVEVEKLRIVPTSDEPSS